MMSFEAFVFSLTVIWITIVASWLFMIAISPPHLVDSLRGGADRHFQNGADAKRLRLDWSRGN
jgi:hypothetical protein